MKLLVIGVDKTGKSTLIEGLRKATKWPIFKFSAPKDAEDAARVCMAGLDASSKFANVLFDRFPYPDDLIYAPVTTKSVTEPCTMALYESLVLPLMQEQDFRVIYCTADPDTIERRFKEDNEDYILPEFIPTLLHGYDAQLDNLRGKLPIMTLNSTTLTMQAMLVKALKFMDLNVNYVKEAKEA